MLGLLRIGPVNRTSTLVVSRCGANATLKSNTDSGEAPRFHPLTERFRNSPTVIGNDNRSRNDKRSGFTWTSLDLDLPPPSAILMRRRSILHYRCSGLIAGGFRFSASGTGRPASHLDNVSSEVIQRRMVGKNEVLVDGQGKAVTDFCHDFGLLHRINAQLSLEVLVHLNEVSRITRVVNHHGDQHLFDVSMGAGWDNGGRNGCRSGCWGRRNSRCGYRRRRRCSTATTLHSLNVANHVVQRRVVGQHEVLVNRKRELVTDVSHDFGLLHRVNAQFTFQVLIEFNEISGVARVFDHNGHHRGGHLSIVNDRGWGRCWCGGRCRNVLRRDRGSGLSRRRGGGCWRGGRSNTAIPRHALNVANHVIERRIISQHEIFVDGESEAFTDVRHDFGLLHRVNAQLSFEILVQFNKVRRVTGMVDNNLDDRGDHFAVCHHGSGWSRYGGCGRLGGCWRHGRSGSCGCSRCSRRIHHRWTTLPLGRWGPRVALDTAVEVVVTVHVGHEFVLQDTHDDVVGASETASPSQQLRPVDAFALNWPSAHERQGDLRAKACGEA